MSFGRLTAAILSGTIDTSVALANLSFDFSLVKVEAPSEYKDLGICLSHSRSKEAENGIAHITARKLGALFSDVAPTAPNLIRAYGLRASEIATSSKFNPRGARNDGIFMDQIGADGTTIWAAATSGNAAISLHLLACMLARIWTGPEATSIWVELVAERKRILSNGLRDRDSLSLASITASEISLTREQLAKWDASARAWLLTADYAKEFPQKQLMLIINNLGTHVDEKSSVYNSVIATWNTAMTVIDGLVSGMPQSIHSGAALLGLSAWHLYPDLLVLGPSTKEIQQGDQLIASGGIATIGLEDKLSKGRGIHWSLPLAHLRFYGNPVSVTRIVGSHSAKLSFDQFLLVALGSFVNTWITSYSELETAVEVLLLMSDLLADPTQLSFNWLQVLADPARAFLASQAEDRHECLQLIKSGCRRYSSFLDDADSHLLPILGLSVPRTLLALCTDNEEKIWLLRKVAKRLENDPYSIIIRTKVLHRYRALNEEVQQWCFECSTVTPIQLQNRGRKRSDGGSRQQIQTGHTRWVELPDYEESQQRLRVLRDSGEDIITLHSGTFCEGYGVFSWVDAPKYVAEKAFGKDRADIATFYTPQQPRVDFQLLFGDSETVALYSFEPVQQDNSFIPEDVKEALLHKSISSKLLRWHLLYDTIPKTTERNEDLWPSLNRSEIENSEEQMISEDEYGYRQRSWTHESESSPEPRKIFLSLRALASVSRVYKSMPESRLSIKAAQQPLYLSNWYTNRQKYLDPEIPYVMSRSETFACIAMFESGSLNIRPSTLDHVMAMSVGNSIYVAEPLLSDPVDTHRDNTIKRVIGNVGKPGIAMLIPPRNPKMRVLPHDSWHCVNHNQFDGVKEDCFQHTTLHLSFSDREMPIDIGNRGVRDSEVFFLEAPIAIHDRGIWVADLDILGSLSDPKLEIKCNYKPCRRPHSGYNTSVDFASIDCWEEILERPLEEGIVRAHKNWQARLAAAALGVQRGHKTFVLSEDFCWNCYEADAGEGHDVFDGNRTVLIPSNKAVRVPDTGLEHYEDDSFEGEHSSIPDVDTEVMEQNNSETWRKEGSGPNVLYIM